METQRNRCVKHNKVKRCLLFYMSHSPSSRNHNTGLDEELLLSALDDDTNEYFLNYTSEKLREMNWKILCELNLDENTTRQLYQKLDGYKYVDEIHELKYGAYLRWIPLENPHKVYLTRGALFCEVKITNKGTYCVCKNMGSGRSFTLSLDRNLIFQRLTDQERVLLSALDHLSN